MSVMTYYRKWLFNQNLKQPEKTQLRNHQRENHLHQKLNLKNQLNHLQQRKLNRLLMKLQVILLLLKKIY